MRALVISDIHANLPALEAVLAAAPQCDAVWNLGDTVGYGAYPNEVIDLVRSLGGVSIRGNHDRACSDPEAFSQHRRLSPVAATAAVWTDAVLTGKNRDWLLNLPSGPVKPLRRNLICVHGSPRDEDDYISSDYAARTALNASGARTILFGHTHEQIEWVSNQRAFYDFQPDFNGLLDQVQFQTRVHARGHTRLLLNPGSVGQPRDGDWRAAFAIYDDTELRWTWHRVAYKVAAAQNRILQAGLPEILASRLEKGE